VDQAITWNGSFPFLQGFTEEVFNYRLPTTIDDTLWSSSAAPDQFTQTQVGEWQCIHSKQNITLTLPVSLSIGMYAVEYTLIFSSTSSTHLQLSVTVNGSASPTVLRDSIKTQNPDTFGVDFRDHFAISASGHPTLIKWKDASGDNTADIQVTNVAVYRLR
jgi:hypothetical protein